MAKAINEAATLRLTSKEARALLLVLRHVGGDPERTPRGALDNVLTALEEQGITPVSWPLELDHSIYFQDMP